MDRYISDLSKIAELFQSQNEANALLGLSICVNLPSICTKTWVEVLDGLGNWYKKWEYSKESSELELLEEQISILVNRLLPVFQREEKGYWISDFIGVYFKSDKINSVLTELYGKLEKKLSKHDWIILLIKTCKTTNIHKAMLLSQDIDIKELRRPGFRIFRAWSEMYIFWKKARKGSGYGQKDYHWHEQWIELTNLILNLIDRYYHQKQLDEACPYIIFEILNELWEDASVIDYNKNIAPEIQARIIRIITLPVFPKHEQQQILMYHTLFKFWENPLQKLGGMSRDCERNIYDKAATTVEQYIANFNQYHHFLEIMTMSATEKNSYMKMVFEVWTYYYLPALEPYFNFMLCWAEINPKVYFYLGQLYHGFRKEKDKALIYFKKYLSNTSAEVPLNNYFISEMGYNTRNYTPGTSEAYTWMAEIYEESGREKEAIESCRKGIRTAPSHHQAPYLGLIKALMKDKNNNAEIFELSLKYYDIFFFTTKWQDKRAYHYNIALEVGECRKLWIKKYTYFTVHDKQICDRPTGYRDFGLSMLYLFYYLAEWFYYEDRNNEKAMKACLKAKACLEDKQHMSNTKYRKISNLLPSEQVSESDVLYLQAELVVELYKDFWQARTLYNKVLTLSPNHKSAKQGLRNVNKLIGY